MDDQTLEREIEVMLAVDPSGDFRARLRQRVAEEPPLRARRPVWRSLSFAVPAAALVVVALVVTLRVDRTHEPAALLPARPIAAGDYGVPAVSAAAPTTSRSTPGRKATVPKTNDGLRTDVILDASEVAAWHRLLRDTGSGRVEIATSAHAADESLQPLPEGFVVPPVIIEPLTADAGEQGVHP